MEPQNETELELAYKDQGYHEMEFTTGNESELHERKKICKKNPEHKEFVKVPDFTIDHLPESYRDSQVFDFIRTIISLTVRLVVTYTSKDRPPDYPLHNRRGKHNLTAYGSGLVRRVLREFALKDDSTCPCRACKQNPEHAKKQWGEFEVRTAMHVVFDDSEAEFTKCDLFFDNDEDIHNCPTLEGVEVSVNDIEFDYSYLSCVTHDEDVYSKLDELAQHRHDLHDELVEKYLESGDVNKDTVVVISHPHGLCKHITVGEYKGVQEEGPYKEKYNAETCQGSSGGPVIGLGRWDGGMGYLDDYIIHSGCEEKGQNRGMLWY